jgi:Pretoxin HINT domain
LKDAIASAGKHVRKCTNCFVAGTLVATAYGLVPSEEVQAGDWVWARDEVTGEVRLCEVEETYRNESPVILEVTAGGETLATTPGHPFWVLDVGWKDAGDLEVGDRLVNLRGESVVVEDIRRRPVPEAVYNFSVAGLHTYFVGQGGIWVHNNSATGCGGGGGAGKAGDAAKGTPIGSTRHVEIPEAENGAYFGMLENGKAYGGKGPPSRARKSLRRKSREHQSPVDDIAYYPEADDAAAFKREAELIEDLGGIGAPDLINQRNSPGKDN